jgi:hypothetical protein
MAGCFVRLTVINQHTFFHIKSAPATSHSVVFFSHNKYISTSPPNIHTCLPSSHINRNHASVAPCMHQPRPLYFSAFRKRSSQSAMGSKGTKIGSVLMCVLLLGLVLEQIQVVEALSCCRNTWSRNCYNVCRLPGTFSKELCGKKCDCKIVPNIHSRDKCPAGYRSLTVFPNFGTKNSLLFPIFLSLLSQSRNYLHANYI